MPAQTNVRHTQGSVEDCSGCLANFTWGGSRVSNAFTLMSTGNRGRRHGLQLASSCVSGLHSEGSGTEQHHP